MPPRCIACSRAAWLPSAGRWRSTAPLTSRCRPRSETGNTNGAPTCKTRGAFVSDLTLTLGLRFEQQRPFQNLDGVYSAVSYQSLWGISGVGNLFKPGTTTGINPTFDRYSSNYYKVPNMWNPSIGLAYRLPGESGPLRFLTGSEKGKSVLRAGYSISTVRNGSNTFQSLLGSNQGLNYDTSISPSSYPADFGAPGSVLFRNSSLPVRSGVPNSPQYPLTPTLTSGLNGYDPNLKMAYVQSWNIGLQREFGHNTVVEVRYTGNHGIKEWRQIDLNEVNLFENGFLKEFYQAQKNLFINRGCQTSWNDCSSTTNSFANAGLPGQGNFPLMQAGLNFTSDANTANFLSAAESRRQRCRPDLQQRGRDGARDGRRISGERVCRQSCGGRRRFVPADESRLVELQRTANRDEPPPDFRAAVQASYVWSHSIVDGSREQPGRLQPAADAAQRRSRQGARRIMISARRGRSTACMNCRSVRDGHS